MFFKCVVKPETSDLHLLLTSLPLDITSFSKAVVVQSTGYFDSPSPSLFLTGYFRSPSPPRRVKKEVKNNSKKNSSRLYICIRLVIHSSDLSNAGVRTTWRVHGRRGKSVINTSVRRSALPCVRVAFACALCPEKKKETQAPQSLPMPRRRFVFAYIQAERACVQEKPALASCSALSRSLALQQSGCI